MAAALLATGADGVDEVPNPRRDDHERGAAAARLRVVYERTPAAGCGRVDDRVPEGPATRPTTTSCARSGTRSRPRAPGRPLRRGPGRPARRQRHRLPWVRHARLGAGRLGATLVSEHGYFVARRPRLAGSRSGWTSRRGRHREPRHGGGPGQGHHVIDNAAREPEIVDLCSMLTRDGRADRRRRHLHGHRRGGGAPFRGDLRRRSPTASSAGTWAVGAVMTRGDVTVVEWAAGRSTSR